MDPSLEFVITSRDITTTGAPATLLIFNNEIGFTSKNIDSICSVGRSTKKGNRKRGYIGEKGIGFKSVFLITAQPYIFSNGYQIRFSEEPCSHCNVGYVVPEWVEENPTLSEIESIHGSGTSLPTTTIVLPLKPDKVTSVKNQLSSVHPELLLFLSKIKRLSVREDNEDPRLKTVSAISISSETNFVTRKNIDADSYMLHLSADVSGDDLEKECGYHMWRQRFPVKEEYKVERRMEVEEWVITLAFPSGKRLHRGTTSPGIYAFLPTEMVTNFPFIIQADFILASSRETILLDNRWNQGILECIPRAFINAFTSLVKETEDAPISSLPPMFGFMPVNSSPYLRLNAVRESIKSKLVNESIVPCESYSEQKFFYKPCEVGRILPAFWNILNKARAQGVVLHNISSHGTYVLSSSFDRNEYNHILNFLGVGPVGDEWYAKCIQSSKLVLGVLEDIFLELLLFVAENWSSCFHKTNIKNIPLLKYVDIHGNVSLSSINEVSQFKLGKMFRSSEPCYTSWLINWNREFRSASDCVFLPKSTQEAIGLFYKRQALLDWLSDEVNVRALKVYDYALLLNKSLGNNGKIAVTYTHFLYHSLSKKYLSEQGVGHLCRSMPLVDNYGHVTTQRRGILLPANGSRWVELIGSNPWRSEGYVELGEDYLQPATYVGIVTREKELVDFLKTCVAASDVPYLSPPNAVIPTMSSQLTKKNVFLLLDWICYLRKIGAYMPERFLTCIKEGSWLKISLSGSPGYRPPSQSFLLNSSTGLLLQQESVLVDIPLIDQQFYGDKINDYKEELRKVGVMFDDGEACRFIGKHLMSLAASSNLTRGNVLSILKFIKFLRQKLLSPENFVNSIKGGRWLRTDQGVRTPTESVLFTQEWKAASQVSNIPFIDHVYYGEELLYFEEELRLIGVAVNFNGSFQLVVDNLKSPACLTSLTPEAVYLILEALRSLRFPNNLVKALEGRKCMKTNIGFKNPSECFLHDPEWACLLQVFSGFPLIDEKYYGSKIFSFKNELKQIGVVVDFDEASKRFVRIFKHQASLSSIGKDNVLWFLHCCRKLKKANLKFPRDLKNSIREVKWLRTRLGDYRRPKECILFGPCWESISPISLLPFIGDSDNHYGKTIFEYEEELKGMGVVVSFKDGAQFVVDSLYLPQNPSSITSENVFSLLEGIRNFQHEKNEPLPSSFLKKIGKKWVKTYYGYCPPDKCLLFNSEWDSFLRRNDGPFIDEEFYGSKITSYRDELNSLGVTVNIKNGCPLLASYLDFHSRFTTISRIYNYLCEFKWEPDGEDNKKIWIPNGIENGEWVSSEECFIHDKNGLLVSQLNVLEQHYEKKLLDFFSNTFGVKMNPSVDDYCKIWKEWEASGRRISHFESCAFWGFVVKNWGLKTEKFLTQKLSKLPAHSGSDEILLVDKHDIFIADDLYLKDLFEKYSSLLLFVWYPQPSLKPVPRKKLLEIYSKIGVRTLSESLQKEVPAMNGAGLEQLNSKEIFIGKGLLRLILGFLADASPNMEAEARHEAVRCLLDVTVLETLEPIKICYTLSLSSGNILKVEASQMLRWERQISKFFVQKLDASGGQKNVIEYASHFSRVVSEGVLWENEDHMNQLAELIRLGFLLKFDEEAIGYLMKTKNLQTFLEDEEFLSSTFPSD